MDGALHRNMFYESVCVCIEVMQFRHPKRPLLLQTLTDCSADCRIIFYIKSNLRSLWVFTDYALKEMGEALSWYPKLHSYANEPCQAKIDLKIFVVVHLHRKSTQTGSTLTTLIEKS